MRGFLSFDEYFNADRTRHDPDHTPWLEYFVGTLGQAARALHERAARLYQAMAPPAPPWEGLSRRQQQQRTRLLARAIAGTHGATEVQAPEVHGWFGVSGNTAREWLSEWTATGFLVPVRGPEGVRVRKSRLSPRWARLVEQAKRESPDSTSSREA